MDKPIKCAAAGYSWPDFFLRQRNGNAQRYVVFSRDKKRIRDVLRLIAENEEQQLELKLREIDGDTVVPDKNGTGTWRAIAEVIDRHADSFFHDGNVQFLLRDAASGEYLAFDEHGLIFFYTDRNLSPVLEALGLEPQLNRPLITGSDHWHYRPPQANEKLAQLIADLRLK